MGRAKGEEVYRRGRAEAGGDLVEGRANQGWEKGRSEERASRREEEEVGRA